MLDQGKTVVKESVQLGSHSRAESSPLLRRAANG